MFYTNSGKGALSLLITVLVLISLFCISLNAEETSPVQDKKVAVRQYSLAIMDNMA